MLRFTLCCLLSLLFLSGTSVLQAGDPVRLAQTPSLSSDGSQLVFSWRGDIWQVSSAGGTATPLTTHPAEDIQPRYSSNGEHIAFTSNRSGENQVFVMPADGGTPRQVSWHSEGSLCQAWFPSGQELLIQGARDHFWRDAERLFRVRIDERSAPRLLFNAYGHSPSISPDGTQVLFVREGTRWWRKGYRGSGAGQIWLYDLNSETFRELIKRDTECRSPLWAKDGKSFYYVGAQSGSLNLWQQTIESEIDDESGKQLTDFEDDSVVDPCISSDGGTLVFRHRFDLYRLELREDAKPVRLEIVHDGDRQLDQPKRRTIKEATEVAFSRDGLEMAFIAGGDLWVMDTELREPVQITNTVEEERSPVFSPDGKMLIFVSDQEGQSDIWQAERSNEEQYWWANSSFQLKRLIHDAEVERDLKWSPAGDRLAYVRSQGDLWTMRPNGQDVQRLIAAWNVPDYDWSPDGKWLVYSVYDNDFNRDIWVMPSDGSAPAVNVSRHPDDEFNPVWSPDGKAIAFTGRRYGEEMDVYFVYLAEQVDQISEWERKFEKAIKKIQEVRQLHKTSGTDDNGDDSNGETSDDDEKEDVRDKSELPTVHIDFDRIHERLRRINIAGSEESNPFWSHDSKRLAFLSNVNGKRGLYTVEPPDDLEPKLLIEKSGENARWIEQGNQILWLVDGKPASISEQGEQTEFDFQAKQEFNLQARMEAAFNLCWRTMRDRWYDERLNNRNWDEVRRKYAPLARASLSRRELSQVVHLMLGELNGSHLGFYPRPDSQENQDDWRPVTPHLGLRFDDDHRGPGWLVRDVIPDGPADLEKSKIKAGEVVLSINGANVDPAMDPTTVLNGPWPRDLRLRVRNADGDERNVVMRPIRFHEARNLLYTAWIEENRKRVAEASDNQLGYLHIRAMNMPSFHEFERQLYAAGAGKQGLVIDVRANRGGFTTDHLLTALTQPVHAITVPRGGGQGYPHGRKVYATWSRPIVVLCNQHSFSNTEIFSHAIKTLKRGSLVGVPTAGGVISTGGTRIMDIGHLRVPFRGWFVLSTGDDMELNGAVPDHILWPKPGEIPAGVDRQLEKAVEVLKSDVQKWRAQEPPRLRRSSERAYKSDG